MNHDTNGITRARFTVTYEVVTPESAEQGDAAERGTVTRLATLRDALDAVQRTFSNECDGVESIECDSWPVVKPRWVTISNGMHYRTGEQESRSLHIPDTVTTSTARRIARLAGARM